MEFFVVCINVATDFNTVPDEKSKERDGFAWFQNEKLYFTPNTKSCPWIPDFQSSDWNPTRRELKLNYFFTPQWFRGRPYAWLSMVAHRVRSCENGSVFELFKDYNMPTYARQHEDKLYRIPEVYRRRWKEFESNVGAVIGTIFDQVNTVHAQIFVVPPPDSMANYTGGFRTEREALFQAGIARSWFEIYIGALFYACLRCSTYRLVRGGQEIFVTQQELPSVLMTVNSSSDSIDAIKFFPLWFARVASVRPELVPFLSLLRYTLSNFRSSLTYVGMFIRVADIHQIGNLAFFTENRIPVAYPWGDAEEAYVREHPYYECYRPPVSIVQDATYRKQRLAQRYDELTMAYDDTNLNESTEHHSTFFEQDSDFFHGGSGLNILERDRPPTPSLTPITEEWTIKDFYLLRDIVSKQKEADETQDQRQERLLRRSRPSRNTPLFLWRENSAGELIRIQIASHWRAVLDAEDSEYQLRYNPWYNTADYAKDFDYMPKPKPAVKTLGSSDLRRLEQEVHGTYRFRIPPIKEEEHEEEDWMDDSPLNIASRRFGFIPIRDKKAASQAEADRLYGRIHEALQLFRHSPSALTCPEDVLPYVERLDEFLNSFRPAQLQDGEIDPIPDRHTWDLHPYPSPVLSTSSFVRNLVRLDSAHTLLGKPEDCSWHMVATNPVDALHACRLREEGLSLRAVALHFLDRGIPFRTMVPEQRQQVERRVPRLTPSTIEVRLHGYRWEKEDYTSYCRLRRAVLMRPGVGFAAFQHGGIVWRIAREELGKLTLATFAAGPDLSGAIEISNDIEGWVDNRLSLVTVAAICGVYHVPTGKLRPRFDFAAHELIYPL